MTAVAAQLDAAVVSTVTWSEIVQKLEQKAHPSPVTALDALRAFGVLARPFTAADAVRAAPLKDSATSCPPANVATMDAAVDNP